MRDFKKDIAKLWFITSAGEGRLLNVTYKEEEVDHVQQFFMNYSVAITTSIFSTDTIICLLDIMDKEFKDKQLIAEKRMIDSWEEVKPNKYTDEFYSEMVSEAIDTWSRYNQEDFILYNHDNICPEWEKIWLSINFITKIDKLFDSITYIFAGDFIIWVTPFSDVPLFIVWGIPMNIQLKLL